ncbi:MAG: UDP-N-acetylmuramoyl-L-alanyl-D-glutamate--2,6-diaminopimelate ligase [Pseudomonadota bacterium]
MAVSGKHLPTLAGLLEGMTIAPQLPVSDVAMDSRQVTEGTAFLAVQGQSRHGIEYAEQAIDAGAIAIVTDLDATDLRVGSVSAVPVICVPGREGLEGVVAARFFGAPTASMDLVAVTGTNGKSSVSWLVAHALSSLGRRPALMGTLGWGAIDALDKSTLTTPDAVTMQRQAAALCEQNCDVIAIEASSHALDQYRFSGSNIDVAVFSNLTRDHLDYHGTMDAYFEAKAQLFDWPGLQARVIAVDDEYGVKLGERYPDAWLVGAPERAARAHSVQIANIDMSANGLVLDVVTPLGDATLRSELIGGFNTQNLALALAVLLSLEVPLDRAIEAVGAAKAPPGRLQVVSQRQPLTVVDYAHTPAALTAAIDALRAHTQGRLWCVFGCGGERDHGKRPQMALAATAADEIVVTSDNPRGESPEAIIADIRAGLSEFEHHVEIDRARAIEHAVRHASPDDVILIAGKGHEQFQLIGDEVRSFDDVEVAAHALGTLSVSAS